MMCQTMSRDPYNCSNDVLPSPHLVCYKRKLDKTNIPFSMFNYFFVFNIISMLDSIVSKDIRLGKVDLLKIAGKICAYTFIFLMALRTF